MTDDPIPENVDTDEDFFPAVGVPERFRTDDYVIGTGGMVFHVETGETVWPPQHSDGGE